jgi:hypothetical protein
MQININDTVQFVLTEYDAEVWNKAYSDCPTLQKIPGPMSEQLWEVMRVLGPTMYNGALNSIESNRLVLPEPASRLQVLVPDDFNTASSVYAFAVGYVRGHVTQPPWSLVLTSYQHRIVSTQEHGMETLAALARVGCVEICIKLDAAQ